MPEARAVVEVERVSQRPVDQCRKPRGCFSGRAQHGGLIGSAPIHDVLHFDARGFAHPRQGNANLVEYGQFRNLDIPLRHLIERYALHVFR
jgi:hypothetical protein